MVPPRPGRSRASLRALIPGEASRVVPPGGEVTQDRSLWPGIGELTRVAGGFDEPAPPIVADIANGNRLAAWQRPPRRLIANRPLPRPPPERRPARAAHLTVLRAPAQGLRGARAAAGAVLARVSCQDGAAEDPTVGCAWPGAARRTWRISNPYEPMSANDGHAAITRPTAVGSATATFAAKLATLPITSNSPGSEPPRRPDRDSDSRVVDAATIIPSTDSSVSTATHPG